MGLTKKERDHLYYLKNRERINEKNIDYWHKNKDKLREKHLIAVKKFSKTPKGIYKTLKRNAIKRGLELLSQDEFLLWYVQEPKECCFCGIPEPIENNLFTDIFGRKTKRLSVDRKESSVGYIRGNLSLCCIRCNIIKSNFFSQEEMLSIGEKYIKPKWQNL